MPAQQTPDRLKFLVEIDVNYGAQVCESVKRALFDVNMAIWQKRPIYEKRPIEIDANYSAQVCASVKRALFDVNMAKETYL